MYDSLALETWDDEEIETVFKECKTLDSKIDALVQKFLSKPGSDRKLLDPVNIEKWVRRNGGHDNPSMKFFLACVDVGICAIVRNYRHYIIFVMKKEVK